MFSYIIKIKHYKLSIIFFLSSFLTLSLSFLDSNYASAKFGFFKSVPNKKEKSVLINDSPKAENTQEDNIKLDVKNEDKHTLKVNEKVKKIDNQIVETDEEKLRNYFQTQKKMDIDDIKTLWEATVARNTVIKFALRKLAIPAEQRRIHSSLMAKTVSTLISGASILPNIFGADSITSSASLAGGKLANRVISSKTMPKELPLTDTELIQLSGLIENLQDKLIKNYYDYKSNIEALRICRQNLLLQNKNYSEAIKAKNDMLMMTYSALYEKELYNELTLKQQIKLHRLELERLAGTQSVANLNLTRLASANFKENNSDIHTKKNVSANKME